MSVSNSNIFRELDEILYIESNLMAQVLDNLNTTCKSNPKAHISVSKDIFRYILTERAALLTTVKKQQPEFRDLSGALSPPSKKREKEKKKKKSLSLRVRKNTIAKSDHRELQQFLEAIDPAFLEKIDFEKFPAHHISINICEDVQTILRGPGDSTMDIQTFENIVSAKAISNYPHIPGRPFREGDPICDRYLVKIYDDHSVIALADGCNWGKMPRKAAKRATKKLVEILEENYQDITNTRVAIAALLLGFSKAQERIMESALDELGPGPGKTTLVGGMLIADPTKNDEYYFVHVALGDCKFFHYSPTDKVIRDITFGNRANISDASDPGGRLGGSKIDVRNLQAGFCKLKDGDFIIAMSDGVHDNFDPQSRGVLPADLGLTGASWEVEMDVEKALQVKTMWMEEKLYKTLKNIPSLNTETIVNALIDECVAITQPSRDFMESNPKQKLPPDVLKYPGKLDHASCVCILAGGKSALTTDFIGNTFADTEEVRLHEALREQQLSCHSIDLSSFNSVQSPPTSTRASWKSTSAPRSVSSSRRTFLTQTKNNL